LQFSHRRNDVTHYGTVIPTASKILRKGVLACDQFVQKSHDVKIPNSWQPPVSLTVWDEVTIDYNTLSDLHVRLEPAPSKLIAKHGRDEETMASIEILDKINQDPR
jgi:hypothetical protein